MYSFNLIIIYLISCTNSVFLRLLNKREVVIEFHFLLTICFSISNSIEVQKLERLDNFQKGLLRGGSVELALVYGNTKTS